MHFKRIILTSVLGATFIGLATSPASSAAILGAGGGGGVTLTTLLLEGDNVTTVGNVTGIDNVIVNNLGSWIVEADTDNSDTDADSVLIKDGVLLNREGQSLAMPAGSTLDSFDAITLNNKGNSGWNRFLDGTTGSDDDSGVYVNDILLIQEGDTSAATGFSAGTTYRGFFETKFNDLALTLVMASVDDPAIPTSVDRALVIVGSGEEVRHKEGDLLPGQTFPIEDFETGPHDFAFNNSNELLFVAELAGAPASEDLALYRDTTLLAQEGSASPIAGRDFEFLTRAVDMNNNSDVAFRANLTGDTETDEVIFRNGVVVAQEGMPVADTDPAIITSLGSTSGPVVIDDNGNLLYYAEWDPAEPRSGLFLNGRLLVEAGVTTIDGNLIDDVADNQDAFAISDNGQYIIFEATLEDGRNGAFLIELPNAAEEATLTSVETTFGIELAGGIPELEESDNLFYRARSAFGFLSSQPNLLRVRVTGESDVSSPNSLDVGIEARLNNPDGNVRISLFNFNTNARDVIGTYMLGVDEQVNTFQNLSAADYLSTAGEFGLQTETVVIATFSLSGFIAFYDEVRVVVE